MSTVSLEKLAATVGAEVLGADHDLLLDDPAMPGWTLDALDANGVLVFRDLHLDDATQVAFSKRLGRVETFNMKDQLPEIFIVTLDREKNPSAQYLKGTFYWHIDGMTEDIPILATLLSAHAVAGEGGETEFASTYQAYDDLTEEELERFSSIRVVHTIEAAQRTFNHDPSPGGGRDVAEAAGQGAPADLAARLRSSLARARRHRRPHRRHGHRRGTGAAGRPPRRATGPDRVYRHEWQVGDLVIWDNTGVLHRALPYDPDLAARHAPHHALRQGSRQVSDERSVDAATADDDAPVSWREAAVARSLDSARTRAESRVQRFLDAALELMADGDGKEFTVQEVVERSGQSLRSFYQYFGGKHELLLALFEESVRTTADRLRADIEKETDPLERLHLLVIGYYRICRPSAKSKGAKKTAAGPTPVLVEFAQQLLTAHPTDAARAYIPLVTLFDEVIGEAIDAGVVRTDVDRASISGVVVEAISFNIFSSTIAGTLGRQDRNAAAEELWRLLFHGLQAR